MNKAVIVIVLVILVLGGLYLGRHKIRTMLIGAPKPTVTQTAKTEVSPTQATISSDNIYKTANDPKKGSYLTDFNGMTLYTFDKDTVGVSNCTGACLKVWPYYTSGATAQKTFPDNITVITRKDDGKMQFAWKGMPLYYYAKDVKAGDILGDGVGGIWHIVKP